MWGICCECTMIFFSRMATPKGEVSFTYLVGLVGLLEPWV